MAETVEFTDPRLVAIYDDLNPYEPGTQPDFYAQLAADAGAATVVELGCGTGLVTTALADRGYRMIGVEPSEPMLAVARARDSRVQWIYGDAQAIGTPAADLAFMSGHVAQFFVGEIEWTDAVNALHRALRPGGTLAFETRNPAAREWEQWRARGSRRVVSTRAGRVEQWIEVDDASEGIVTYRNCYSFLDNREVVVSRGQLRFRTAAELKESLTHAGFAIVALYGDWNRRPATATTREIIVVASR